MSAVCRIPKKESGTSVILVERAVSSCDWNHRLYIPSPLCWNFLEFGEAKLSSLDCIKTLPRLLGATQLSKKATKEKLATLFSFFSTKPLDIRENADLCQNPDWKNHHSRGGGL